MPCLDGQELKDDAQDIDIAQSAEVEAQSAPRHGHHVTKGHTLEGVAVHVVEHPACEHIHGHNNQEIDGHDKARLAPE